MGPYVGETLCESGRCIDALKERRRALKKRGRVLKKRGRVLKKRASSIGGGLLKKGGGFLRTLWRSSRSSTPSRRHSVCLPKYGKANSPVSPFALKFKILAEVGRSHTLAKAKENLV